MVNTQWQLYFGSALTPTHLITVVHCVGVKSLKYAIWNITVLKCIKAKAVMNKEKLKAQTKFPCVRK